MRANTRQRKFVQIALENATSYEDWARAANELDDLDGKDASTFQYTDRSLFRPECLERRPDVPCLRSQIAAEKAKATSRSPDRRRRHPSLVSTSDITQSEFCSHWQL